MQAGGGGRCKRVLCAEPTGSGDSAGSRRSSGAPQAIRWGRSWRAVGRLAESARGEWPPSAPSAALFKSAPTLTPGPGGTATSAAAGRPQTVVVSFGLETTAASSALELLTPRNCTVRAPLAFPDCNALQSALHFTQLHCARPAPPNHFGCFALPVKSHCRSPY